ncbi:MAG: pilin [Betaproteobacteria bacterium]|nr:pilin [Betaproteobacteria bacterium]
MVRARVAEGFLLAESAQRAVAEHHDRWGTMPTDNAAAGLPRPEALRGTSVASVTVHEGAVRVRFAGDVRLPAEARGKGFSLLPAINKDYPTAPIVWVCSKSKLPTGFQLIGEPAADPLPGKYLPAACR